MTNIGYSSAIINGEIERVMTDESIGRNDITTLEILNQDLIELPENIFSDLPNLRELWLSENNISVLPANIFNNLPNFSMLPSLR